MSKKIDKIKRISPQKIISLLFTRAFVVAILLIAQMWLIFSVVINLFDNSINLYVAALTLSLFVAIYLTSTRDNPAYKLAWMIFIFAMPPMGAIVYLFFGMHYSSSKKIREINELYSQTCDLLDYNKTSLNLIKKEDLAIYQQFFYLSSFVGESVYQHTQTKYLSMGEIFFSELKIQLRKAKKFIFLEYFIVDEGIMWDSILEILIAKVKEGVEVRLMYDDMGSLFSLPTNYDKKMARLGIQTVAFNRFRPLLEIQMNNRDHRKITVIDGIIGFVGGINLADEYINVVKRHGHWKDTAVMIEGEAVWSLTVMFLQFWNINKKTDKDYSKYKNLAASEIPSDGFVQPFSDAPQDNELVSKNVYLNLINKATNSIYITTPYLIIDNEMVTALTMAAKNGIDVKLILPGIPDKWYVYFLSQAFYIQLIEAGVQIYEYLPGFIHAKTFLIDGEIGVVGTINLDYRSLYLHFECGILMYRTHALKQMTLDWTKTLDQCRLICLEQVKEVRISKRILRGILRVLAPLM